MRSSSVYQWSITLIVILSIAAICGCSDTGSSSVKDKPIKTGISVNVQVKDQTTNRPVPAVAVYLVAGNPGGNGTQDFHLSQMTDNDGYAYFTVNYSLKVNDTIYVGASTDQSSVESDFASKDFLGVGKIGLWRMIDYESVRNDQGKDAEVFLYIVVDKNTGKMIE